MKTPKLISLFTTDELEMLLFQIHLYSRCKQPQNENFQLYKAAEKISAAMPAYPLKRSRATSATFSNYEIQTIRTALHELNRKKMEQGLECLPLHGILIKLSKLQAGI